MAAITVKAKCLKADTNRFLTNDKPVVSETISLQIVLDPAIGLSGNLNLTNTLEANVGKYVPGTLYDVTL